MVSSPVVQEELLIAATFDSWIKGSSFLGEKIWF